MWVGILALLSGLALIASTTPAQTPAQTSTTGSSGKSGLALPREKWIGDLDGMIKRRIVRVLVPYSKTYYFVDRAVQRGLSYDVTRLLEADLNKKLKTGHMRLSVVCIPVNRGQMIPGLLEGQGDIAMGNLTITPERLKHVDFTQPFMPSRSPPPRTSRAKRSTSGSPRAITRASKVSTRSSPRRASRP
jgi:ABC-type amino acid transport substrate-binding protein